MKKPILLAAIFLVIITCSFSGKNGHYNFVGKWSETWGVGQETDVAYHDKYTITRTADGAKEISCQSNEAYRFIDVVFEKMFLTFKIVNTSGNDTLPYSLQIDKKSKKMKGHAYSIRGVKTNIEWIREK